VRPVAMHAARVTGFVFVNGREMRRSQVSGECVEWG
jgi:hypothetical protein